MSNYPAGSDTPSAPWNYVESTCCDRCGEHESLFVRWEDEILCLSCVPKCAVLEEKGWTVMPCGDPTLSKHHESCLRHEVEYVRHGLDMAAKDEDAEMYADYMQQLEALIPYMGVAEVAEAKVAA